MVGGAFADAARLVGTSPGSSPGCDGLDLAAAAAALRLSSPLCLAGQPVGGSAAGPVDPLGDGSGSGVAAVAGGGTAVVGLAGGAAGCSANHPGELDQSLACRAIAHWPSPALGGGVAGARRAAIVTAS